MSTFIIFLENALIETEKSAKRNWVLATNSDFQIAICLQPDGVNLWYFKLWIILDQMIIVWNIKG